MDDPDSDNPQSGKSPPSFRATCPVYTHEVTQEVTDDPPGKPHSSSRATCPVYTREAIQELTDNPSGKSHSPSRATCPVYKPEAIHEPRSAGDPSGESPSSIRATCPVYTREPIQESTDNPSGESSSPRATCPVYKREVTQESRLVLEYDKMPHSAREATSTMATTTNPCDAGRLTDVRAACPVLERQGTPSSAQESIDLSISLDDFSSPEAAFLTSSHMEYSEEALLASDDDSVDPSSSSQAASQPSSSKTTLTQAAPASPSHAQPVITSAAPSATGFSSGWEPQRSDPAPASQPPSSSFGEGAFAPEQAVIAPFSASSQRGRGARRRPASPHFGEGASSSKQAVLAPFPSSSNSRGGTSAPRRPLARGSHQFATRGSRPSSSRFRRGARSPGPSRGSSSFTPSRARGRMTSQSPQEPRPAPSNVQDRPISPPPGPPAVTDIAVSLHRPREHRPPPIRHVNKPGPRPLQESTPPDFDHYLMNRHPWVHLVNPRSYNMLIDPNIQAVADLPVDDYRHLPSSAYNNTRFARSLFPRIDVRAGRPVHELPFIELQHLEDTVAFRDHTLRMVEDVLGGAYDELGEPQEQPTNNPRRYLLSPEFWRGKRPVLYQVVSLGWRSGVILESKDIFVPGPDRRELHCMIMDFRAVDITNGQEGFDKASIAIKDFVWVYDVKPSNQAFTHPEEALTRSRIHRTTALNNTSTYFFRVAHFALVPPREQIDRVFGIVMALKTHRQGVNSFKAVFEGAPDSVVVSAGICRFDLLTVRVYQFLLADARCNVSCAMRFSEPPASIAAREQLCELVKAFLPMHPWEGVRPLRVFIPNMEELAWLEDRAARFENFARLHEARRRMLKWFNVACSGIAAFPLLPDDLESHWVWADIPSLSVYPLRLDFVLHDMASEVGWTLHRPVAVWIDGASTLTFVKVREVVMDPVAKTLRVSVHASHWSQNVLFRAVSDRAQRVGDIWRVFICVRLCRPPTASQPAYACISRAQLPESVPVGSRGDGTMNAMYGRAEMTCALPNQQTPMVTHLTSTHFRFRGRQIALTQDQQAAMSLGFTEYPVSAIQAAFGTGKTAVGALLAANLCKAGVSVIVTAITNTAVAQFADTLLGLDDFQDISMVRYISDAASADNTFPTAADLNVILKSLGDTHGDRMTPTERGICREFTRSREALERLLRDPERALLMSEEEKEECFISDQYASRNLKKMVDLMFKYHAPAIIFATTSSLINIIGTKGLFKKHMPRFTVLIGGEASQIPEPVVVTFAMLLPWVRQVYIGDVHQLEPHVSGPANSSVAIYGARSVMKILTDARAVHVAPLRTTFRSHPRLIELPNRVAYEGSLVSGVRAEDRRMLLSVMRFPSPEIPFMFIDVPACSTRAQNKSHFNEVEAQVCWNLVNRLLEKGISPAIIAVIAFYREQFRQMHAHARELNIEMATVDSVQGREKEVVVVLTTRTDAEPHSAEFLDNYRRMNVALSRCRHGQFILGHAESLARIPFWGRVLEWSRSLNAVVPHVDLDRYFQDL